MKIIVKTLKGLEEVLASEIRELGGLDVTPISRAVAFEGSRTLLYKANLQLRTALRVLIPLFEFDAKDENEVYDRIHDHDWTSMIPVDRTFAIDSVVNSSTFRHANYIALKTKDAIVDRIRKDKGARPSVDSANPDIQLHLHIRENHVSVSLDSSGDSLHKRGYRQKEGDAPLNEVLAAGLILLSGWDGRTPFTDPMCGSGTLLVEAARYAKNIPPQNLERNFNFKNWADFDETMWNTVIEQVKDERKKRSVDILGSDINRYNVRSAEINLRAAGLSRSINVRTEDFFETEARSDESFILTNPPYDYRIKADDICDFYMKMGYTLKMQYPNSTSWIISGNIDGLKCIGMKPEKKYQLMNGGLDATFCKYNIFPLKKMEPKKTIGQDSVPVVAPINGPDDSEE